MCPIEARGINSYKTLLVPFSFAIVALLLLGIVIYSIISGIVDSDDSTNKDDSVACEVDSDWTHA
jgi:hypothetical protein